MSQSMPHVSFKPQRRSGAGIPGVIKFEDPAVQVVSHSLAAVVQEEAIARRAYEKFVARGGVHGGDQKDWTDAKNEIFAETRKP